MTSDNFVLSEKICGTTQLGSFTSKINDELMDVILVEDVKEFIRRLKKDMELTWDNCKVINKLAGDELI